MAIPINNLDLNHNDYVVGEKYRFPQVIQDEVVRKQDEKVGIPAGEITSGNDMENMLNVYLDENGVWTLNVNSSFYAIGIPDEVFQYFIVPSDMLWPTISWHIYATTRLAWLLMKLNEVKDSKVFMKVPSGTAIKYLPKAKYIDPILEAIRGGNE